MIPHDKLFIPGPVEVSEKTLAAFSRPMIGHRGDAFKNLYRDIHPKLQTLFGTKQPVFLSTSSAWGVMEASLRNLVDRDVLCCMCGAFSDKWLDVARRCGKNAEPLQVDWGKHIDHKDIDAKLATGKFDTVTLIHNETSTGVMNPLPEICCTLAKYPDIALIVDTVSSFSAMKIDMDALRHRRHAHRLTKGACPSHPAFPLLRFRQGIRPSRKKKKTAATTSTFSNSKTTSRMDDAEHPEHRPHLRAAIQTRRYLRRRPNESLRALPRTNSLVHDWVCRNGFDFFAEEGFRSKTLTCVKNNRGIDVLKLAKDLREKHHLVIDPGYGKLKAKPSASQTWAMKRKNPSHVL